MSKNPDTKKPKIKNLKEQREELIENLGIKQLEFEMPEIGFVDQKADKEYRKQAVKEKIFGLSQEENVNKRQKIVKRFITVLFIVFVVAVLIYTAYEDFFAPGKDFLSWESFGKILLNGIPYLLLAFVALFANYFFKGLKLSVVCKSLTGKFHFKTCFETGIIGNYYNTVTPFATGGQAFEIHHLSKHGVDSSVAYSATIASFFLNQFCFVTLGIIFLALFKTNYLHLDTNIYFVFPKTINVLAIIGLCCCTLMPFLILMFSLTPKFGAFVVKFGIGLLGKLRLIKDPATTTVNTIKNLFLNAECLRRIAKNPICFISCILFSFFEHFATVSLTFFVLRIFGYTNFYMVNGSYVPASNFLLWLQSAQVTIILFATIAFIPTPGNSGAADLSFFLFFQAGLSAGLAFPATMIWRLLTFYSYIIIGFSFATLKKRADRKKIAQNDFSNAEQLSIDLESIAEQKHLQESKK